MLSDELDSKPEVICCDFVSKTWVHILDCACSCVEALLFFPSAAGAVCPERVHPPGPGSGGLGVQTLLPASAGPG